MYSTVNNTLYLGKIIHHYPECASTNAVASDLLKNRILGHGDLIITDFQSKGKGQAGNSWESSPGENLTLSIYLSKPPVKPENQFNLNMAVSLSVRSFFQKFLGDGVSVKWPNDILYKTKKISGILIENSIRQFQIESSILGMGININQEYFEIDKATSLSIITGRKFNLEELLTALLIDIETYLELLTLGKIGVIKKEYLSHLYGRGIELLFRDEDEFRGIIKGIDDQGRLLVDKQGVVHSFDFKEITFLS